MVIFLFSVHIITEAKQYARRSRAVYLQPGHLIWCSATTGRHQLI